MSGKINLNTSSIKLNANKVRLGRLSWSFLETSADAFAYSPRSVTAILAGASGCATVSEAHDYLDTDYPASGYLVGNYARVSVFDDNAMGCGTYHWFVVVI
jgi:hypothetical protein